MFFGVSSNTFPTSIMIKKMLLVSIAANILSHNVTVTPSTEENGKGASVTIKAVLGYSLQHNTNNMPIYATFDDTYWHRVKVLQPVIL